MEAGRARRIQAFLCIRIRRFHCVHDCLFWKNWPGGGLAASHGSPLLLKSVVGVVSGSVAKDAKVLHDKGYEFCYAMSVYGGTHGPGLTYAGDRMAANCMTTCIYSGAPNLPSYIKITQQELSNLIAFLRSRRRLPTASTSEASVAG